MTRFCGIAKLTPQGVELRETAIALGDGVMRDFSDLAELGLGHVELREDARQIGLVVVLADEDFLAWCGGLAPKAHQNEDADSRVHISWRNLPPRTHPRDSFAFAR